MIRKLYLAIALIASAFLGAPTMAGSKPVIISDKGVAEFKIGMSKKEIQKIVPRVKFDEEITEGCTEAEIKSRGIGFLVEDGILTRISMSTANYQTDKSVGVGSTEAQLKAAYGARLTIEPHKYNEKGHYLSVINKDGSGIMFETGDNARVFEMFVGKKPSLQYVEGCL